MTPAERADAGAPAPEAATSDDADDTDGADGDGADGAGGRADGVDGGAAGAGDRRPADASDAPEGPSAAAAGAAEASGGSAAEDGAEDASGGAGAPGDASGASDASDADAAAPEADTGTGDGSGGRDAASAGDRADDAGPAGDRAGTAPGRGSVASGAGAVRAAVPPAVPPAPAAPAPAAPAPAAPVRPSGVPTAALSEPSAAAWTGLDGAPSERPGPTPAFGTGRPTRPEATRAQPLPPEPVEPLQLLASLTNTPPPPPTFVRTSLRRIKIWSPLVLLLVIVFCVVQALRPLPQPSLSLSMAATYDFRGSTPSMPWPSEGQAALEVQGLGSLGTFGKQKPEPIASVAKIMTAYIVLHDHPMKQGASGVRLTMDTKAAQDAKLGAEGESVVEVRAGQRISQYEALEDLMLASANNIARFFARWDAGSEAAFVKKMNATAKSLGMTHTRYTDPSGLTATTVSTASDQLKLVEKAMANPVFRQVVAEPSYRTADGVTYNNWNHLVGTNDVVGVKTGTSTAAGGNLVFAAYKDVGGTTELIIGVVLGQYKPSILDTVTAASLRLILAAQHTLIADQPIRKGAVVGYVDDGFGHRTPVVATRAVRAVGWPGLKVPVKLAADGTLPHTAKAGTRVGTLTVGDGPGRIRVPVALGSDVTAPGLGDKLGRLG